jgi:Zn-dependent protease with chaperone function
VRRGRGYGLLVGDALEPHHLEAVLGHEIAHHRGGDLLWEAFTDGPARLLLPAVRKVPPLVCAVFPFLLLGAPLARATELRADRLAAARIPSYPVVLAEVAKSSGGAETLLYPSLRERVRRSARHSETA